MKKIIALCFVALFLCFTPGCVPEQNVTHHVPKRVTDYEAGEETPKKGGTLRLALAGAGSLNPILAENEHNLYMLNLVYDSLFRRNEKEMLEQVLCSKYSVSPDGRHYTFTIRDGIVFHNGDKLTAHDVEATIAMIRSNESIYQTKLSAIASCASSGNTLYITLDQPIINFPALLDFPVLSDADISVYDPLAYVPNGTGRYKVQSYKKSKELYLSVNENYFRDFTPYIDKITIYLVKDAGAAVTMLENMQIDALSSHVINLHAYTPKRNLSSVEYISGKFVFVGVNNQRQALLTAKTRLTLSAALDRESILSGAAVPYGVPAEVPVPDKSFWNDGETSTEEPDLQRVKTMLSEDGWSDADADGVPTKDVYGEQVALAPGILVNSDNAAMVAVAEQVKTAWNAVGVPAYTAAVPFDEYQSRIESGNYDVFIGNVSLTENYDLSFMLKTNSNFLGFSNETVDKTLYALTVSGQEAHKQAQFYELCNILRSEMPLLGLYFESDVLIFDPRVKGNIHPSGSDVFYSIDQWFLSE